MTSTHTCLLSPRCGRENTDQCGPLCFPWRKLQALQSAAHIPDAYRGVTLPTLPFKPTNPKATAFLKSYIDGLRINIAGGTGLFFYSVPSRENARGTGTGKTTAACCILNEFLCRVVIEQCKSGMVADDTLALFVNASQFQNVYNAQFRGTDAMQQSASAQYYALKGIMLSVGLLALDDLGIRGATEAFRSEVYEIIDARGVGRKTTLITSNMGVDGIGTVLDERIASRIAAMCAPVQFTGIDHRQQIGGAFQC